MKRIICLLSAAILLLTPAYAVELLRDDAITIDAPSAILMEKTTGEIIYEKAADTRCSPASVTKVMTMLLIMEQLESGGLSLTDLVTASAHAAGMGGSQIWLKEGEQLTVDDMLKCIAVSSANDCAVAMAEHLCGTEEAFVARMNSRAAELGMENTHFINCTGLTESPEHYTTARDVALMSRELIRHDRIKDYTTIWMDTIRNGAFGLSNTNKLIYYYPGSTGLKTGFTKTAMYCLSATAERDGVEYIAVIMHADSIEKRNESAKTLLNYAFANYALVPLRAEQALPPIPVEMGAADCVQPVYDGPDAVLLEKKLLGSVRQELSLPESVRAPIRAGERLGSLQLLVDGTAAAEAPLVAADGVDAVGFWQLFCRMIGILAGST